MSSLFWVHIAHILVFSSLLFYIGLVGKKLPSFIYPLLILLAIGVFSYHVYKAWTKPVYAWVNYIHIFLVVPLFLLIGYYGKNVSPFYYEYCLMIGFASLGYHLFYLWKDLAV
jgi:hypothetical protein